MFAVERRLEPLVNSDPGRGCISAYRGEIAGSPILQTIQDELAVLDRRDD